MIDHRASGLAVLCACVLSCPPVASPAGPEGAPIGPDLVLDDIYNTRFWGQVGDILAYSIATDICNHGDENAEWDANTNQHPVIAQNLYRLKDDRMEQIGMSWLKHGFAAANRSDCGACQDPGHDQLLGVGCNDQYSPVLNGDQDGVDRGEGLVGGLGPRSEVNASSGAFVWPYGDLGESGDEIYKRLQVHIDDVEPLLNEGARYFVEGQQVSADEALAGNGVNSVSYREVEVEDDLDLGLVAPTQPGRDALLAWQDVDPAVQITDLELAEVGGVTGIMRLASKVTDLGNGFWRYEYALHNINSHRAAAAFTIPVAEGVAVTNVGFHDVDYHSGEPYDLTDWEVTMPAGGDGYLSWSVAPFSPPENVNALRWGTTYNFRFDADIAPEDVCGEVTLFRTPFRTLFSTTAPIAAPVPVPCTGAELVELSGIDETGTEIYEACDRITAGPAYVIEGSADITFSARKQIELFNGFVAADGALFTAELTPFAASD